MLFKRPSIYFYNDDVLAFIERNGMSLDFVDSTITSGRDIIEGKEVDSITEFVSLYEEECNKTVSVADILGYDNPARRDFFESMSVLFDSQGDSYHSRSVGMLLYSSDEVVSKLESSFVIEPLKVKEVQDGKYFIDGNGMHRYAVLRANYLLDKSRGILSDSELRAKYEIPVISKKLDAVKTYCAYLIKLVNEDLYISSELDDNYRKTGRVKITGSKNEPKFLSDDELIIYTMEIVDLSNIDVVTLLRINRQVGKNQKFREFLETYFKDLYSEIIRFNEFKNSLDDPADVYNFKINASVKESEQTWNF